MAAITGPSKEAAGQTCAHGNPNVEGMDKDNKHFEAKLEILIDSLDEDKKKDAVAVAGDHAEGSKPLARIQRAPSVVRDNKNLARHLEPKAFFFGPIQHKKQTPADKKTKMKLAARFIRDSSIDKQAALNNVLREIDNVRKCYENEVIKDYDDDDEELAGMLFVDGCVLLFYIVSFIHRSLYKLSIENLPVAYVENDIFLLENQLPYSVLDLIVRGTDLEEKMPCLIDDFVKIQSSIQGVTIGETPKMGKWKPNHLLELLWMRMTRHPEWSWADEDIEHRIFWQDSLPSIDHGTVLWYPSRSVSELKSVRINVKPNNSIWLRDITFQPSRYSGELELRSLIVHAHTAVKLSNLIAYEMCPDFKNDLEVTSYVCFLSSLLRDVQDVAKLRSNKVLVNLLPSDDNVCQLFRELATDLVPNPTLYDHVRMEIGEYFDHENTTTIATWWVDAAEVYFKTPWSTITVLAAAFAILLSLVQTWFTISPRKSC